MIRGFSLMLLRGDGINASRDEEKLDRLERDLGRRACLELDCVSTANVGCAISSSMRPS